MTTKRKKNLWVYLGMAVGLISMIVGLVFLFKYQDETFIGSYSHLGNTEFGGDFYTYSYRATAFAGNAVAGVYEMISVCFGWLFILLGAADICAFGRYLSNTDRSEVQAEPENNMDTAELFSGQDGKPAGES